MYMSTGTPSAFSTYLLYDWRAAYSSNCSTRSTSPLTSSPMRDRSVIADLNALRDAAENSDAALVYVLTRYDVETLATLRELLEGRYRDLANRVTVIEAAQLIKLYQLLQSLSVRELLSRLFRALVDVHAQGGVVGDQG